MTPNNGIERTPKDEWIAQDNPVRVVDAFVEELDRGQPGFDRATPAETGRPGYHLATLLKIYIYSYLNELDPADREPALVPQARVEQLKEKIATVKAHMRKLKRIEKVLPNAPDEQISLTDPDARSMATSGRGTGIVGYNVQAAVDTRNQLTGAPSWSEVSMGSPAFDLLSKSCHDQHDRWVLESTCRRS